VSALDLAVAQLRVDEGFRANVYKDSQGNATIGYGFAIGSGLSKPAALALLSAQVADLQNQLTTYYWWAALDDPRASAVLNVAFNVGLEGLLHFPKMLAAIAVKDWQTAHDQLLNSDAARLNVDRYKRLAQTLLLGTPSVAAA
jgi:lysozyme